MKQLLIFLSLIFLVVSQSTERQNPFTIVAVPFEPSLLYQAIGSNPAVTLELYRNKAWALITSTENVVDAFGTVSITRETAIRIPAVVGGMRGQVGAYFQHPNDNICALVQLFVQTPWAVECRDIDMDLVWNRDGNSIAYAYAAVNQTGATEYAFSMDQNHQVLVPDVGLIGFLTDPGRTRLFSYTPTNCTVHVGVFTEYSISDIHHAQLTSFHTDVFSKMTNGLLTDPTLSTFVLPGMTLWAQLHYHIELEQQLVPC